ncbi:MAG: type II toxin-antitoxin system VapC family toxin [Boseongicola sp.]|nr:type II toxin-antitoxin system VapC family toxin [Boseongicola sp.]MDE0345107.1 type II toxin-antitoxin system VapC family toxin [Boseongicola sp.]
MIYLLDTDVISDMVRNPRGSAATALSERDDTKVATSVIVAGELRYGCHKNGSHRLTERVEALLAEISVLSVDVETAAEYGRIRAHLEARGQMTGGNDLWIAAHAISREAVLVSGNSREFKRVPGLQLENWLAPGSS